VRHCLKYRFEVMRKVPAAGLAAPPVRVVASIMVPTGLAVEQTVVPLGAVDATTGLVE